MKEINIASKEAEQLILGRMLQSEQDRTLACNSLEEEFFFFKEHKCLFSCLIQLEQNQKPADIHLLIETLKQTQQLEIVNGPEYLITLAQAAPISICIEEYTHIIKGHWVKREALNELTKLQAKISSSDDIQGLFSHFSQAVGRLTGTLDTSSAKSFKQISIGNTPSFIESLSFRRDYFLKNQKPFIDGVSTGYEQIDNLIGGFGNSNLIILASRPGMGKTAFALNLAERIATNNPVGIISLEMSSTQLYERMLSMESGVPGDIIREGKASDNEWKEICAAEEKVAKLPIYVHEGSCFIKEIITKARRFKEEQGIKLLIIDYLQLIQGKGETRLLEISNITRDLKNLCVELHIPIICLAQLSRKVEERVNHKPLLSDLRESGTIEQDADVVSFLMRPDYYDSNTRPNEADVIIAKNRHGKVGETTLVFQKNVAKFEALIQKECDKYDIF